MRRINLVIREMGLSSVGLLAHLGLRPGLFKVIAWLARLLYGLRIQGEENIPRTGACLMVMPLASLIDGVGIFFIRSVRVDLRGLGTCRWVMRSPNPNLFTPWAHVALAWLRRGGALGLLPEGGIRWDGRPRALRPGAAWLALHAHVPVVAVVVKGGYDIWPRWARRPKLTGKLTIRVGKPFYVADGSQARVNEAMIPVATEKIAREIARLEHDDP